MAATYHALIGDLVASRHAADRLALHRQVAAALDGVNAVVAAELPLYPSVGDEVQGLYRTLGAALQAAHRLRLSLPPEADIRFGLGEGDSHTIDADRRILDGSAWWRARDAIQDVEKASARSSHAALRTGISAAADDGPAPAVRAAVALADVQLHRLDDTSRSILSGIVGGLSQDEIARAAGLSKQAVSQRIIRHGLAVLAESLSALWEEA